LKKKSNRFGGHPGTFQAGYNISVQPVKIGCGALAMCVGRHVSWSKRVTRNADPLKCRSLTWKVECEK
jgi:hypothetical protein